MLETSNLSVGRGTDQPFEIIGAPWVDSDKLAAALNAAKVPGLHFEPAGFTPTSSKFAGQLCRGVRVAVTDRRALAASPVSAGVTIAWHLEHLFKDAYQLEDVAKMLQNDDAMKALQAAADPAKVPNSWREELAAFRKVREKHLLYR
jgi:uncharacterized protein YbbC (DUF1343 family)